MSCQWITLCNSICYAGWLWGLNARGAFKKFPDLACQICIWKDRILKSFHMLVSTIKETDRTLNCSFHCSKRYHTEQQIHQPISVPTSVWLITSASRRSAIGWWVLIANQASETETTLWNNSVPHLPFWRDGSIDFRQLQHLLSFSCPILWVEVQKNEIMTSQAKYGRQAKQLARRTLARREF